MSPLPTAALPIGCADPADGSAFLSFLHAEPNARDTVSNAIAIRMAPMLPSTPVRFTLPASFSALAITCSLALPTRAAPASPVAPAPAHPSKTLPEIKLPPGTRADATGTLISGRGLRDTTDFIAKQLDRRGITARQVGPYRVHGAELTRFLSETPSTTWLAIHVLRTGGKTAISFVPRPPS
jgi:hypothetical protein